MVCLGFTPRSSDSRSQTFNHYAILINNLDLFLTLTISNIIDITGRPDVGWAA